MNKFSNAELLEGHYYELVEAGYLTVSQMAGDVIIQVKNTNTDDKYMIVSQILWGNVVFDIQWRTGSDDVWREISYVEWTIALINAEG